MELGCALTDVHGRRKPAKLVSIAEARRAALRHRRDELGPKRAEAEPRLYAAIESGAVAQLRSALDGAREACLEGDGAPSDVLGAGRKGADRSPGALSLIHI